MRKSIVLAASVAVLGAAVGAAAAKEPSYSIKQAWPKKLDLGKKQRPNETPSTRQAPASGGATAGRKPADTTSAARKPAPARQGVDGQGTEAQGVAQ